METRARAPPLLAAGRGQRLSPPTTTSCSWRRKRLCGLTVSFPRLPLPVWGALGAPGCVRDAPACGPSCGGASRGGWSGRLGRGLRHLRRRWAQRRLPRRRRRLAAAPRPRRPTRRCSRRRRGWRRRTRRKRRRRWRRWWRRHRVECQPLARARRRGTRGTPRRPRWAERPGGDASTAPPGTCFVTAQGQAAWEPCAMVWLVVKGACGVRGRLGACDVLSVWEGWAAGARGCRCVCVWTELHREDLTAVCLLAGVFYCPPPCAGGFFCAGPTACGIKWRDQQVRENRAAFAASADDASAAAYAADDGAYGGHSDDGGAYGFAGGGEGRRVAVAAAAAGRAAGPPPVPSLARRRPRGRASMRGGTGPWRCQRCLKCVTPCHRPGPGGKGTLCNGTCAGGAVRVVWRRWRGGRCGRRIVVGVDFCCWFSWCSGNRAAGRLDWQCCWG